MESLHPNLSYLPEVFSLAVLIGCFRPLVRRAGPHVNLWFVGWTFLLLHFAALCFLPPQANASPFALAPAANPFIMLAVRWSLDLCALCFVLVSESLPCERVRMPLATAFAIPVMLQAALAIFPQPSLIFNLVTVLLFITPALYFLLTPRHRSRQLTVVCVAWLLLGALTFRPGQQYPDIVSAAVLSTLFFVAAYLFLRSAARTDRGVLAAVAGLIGWGLAYIIVPLFNRIAPAAHISRTILELPAYLTAGGIMLTLLEDHVLRTERLAMRDPLTDLPNRRMFEERFSAALEEARLEHTTIACLVIDVDNFKIINDVIGHDGGDQVLRALAVRLSWHITPRDLLARTGGDEFTAMLAGVTDEHHLKFIAGAMMSAASIPIMVDGKPVDVRISIGIALSPDDADDTEGLRRAADQAMYVAKRRGGSLLAFAGDTEELPTP